GKTPAPRLDSLDGRIVYLIDSRFDDSVELLKQIQAWFAEHMPGVEVRLRQMASTYAKDDPALWEEIRDAGAAAIIGVGHCSTCAPAVSTHAVTLETKYGVPAVAVHTEKFVRVVRSVTRMAGLPQAPLVFVPQPVMGKSEQELKAYVDGNDPFTGVAVMKEIVDGLTIGLGAAQAKEEPARRATPRTLSPQAEEALHDLFLNNDWTDKLRIVLPTEKRVAQMLRGTSHDPQEVVGRMQPTANR